MVDGEPVPHCVGENWDIVDENRIAEMKTATPSLGVCSVEPTIETPDDLEFRQWYRQGSQNPYIPGDRRGWLMVDG